MYVLPKEISSSMKFTKSLYLFDIVFIGVFLTIAWALSPLVYNPLIVLYYISIFIIAVILTSKSKINPQKRKYQSIYYALIRNRNSYIKE